MGAADHLQQHAGHAGDRGADPQPQCFAARGLPDDEAALMAGTIASAIIGSICIMLATGIVIGAIIGAML